MVRKDIVQGTHEFRGETFDVKEIVKTKSKYIDTYHEATFKPIYVMQHQEGNLGVLIADQNKAEIDNRLELHSDKHKSKRCGDFVDATHAMQPFRITHNTTFKQCNATIQENLALPQPSILKPSPCPDPKNGSNIHIPKKTHTDGLKNVQ